MRSLRLVFLGLIVAAAMAAGDGLTSGQVENLFQNSNAEQNVNGFTTPVVDAAFYYDGAAFHDSTDQANGTASFTILADTDDYFYIGVQGINAVKFSGIRFTFDPDEDAGSGYDLVWEHWDGAEWVDWGAEYVGDGTAGFSQDGTVDFTNQEDPKNRKNPEGKVHRKKVNGVIAHWWRVSTSQLPTSPAVVQRIEPNPAEQPPTLDSSDAAFGASSVRFGFQSNHEWERTLTFRAQDNYSRFLVTPGASYVIALYLKRANPPESVTGELGIMWLDEYGNLMRFDSLSPIVPPSDWDRFHKIAVAPTRADWSRVYTFDGSTFVDETSEANSEGGEPITLFDDAGDHVYFGATSEMFGEVVTTLETDALGSDVEWQYWNGSAWVPLAVTGNPAGAEDFTTSGRIKFIPPAEWERNEVHTFTAYWVRVVSNWSPWTAPTANQAGWGNAHSALPYWEEFIFDDQLHLQLIDGVMFYEGDTLEPYDTDGDGYPDEEDNCPTTPTPWFVPDGDSDCDGFTDDEEAFVGTDPADACPDNLDDDAWPADMAAAEGYGKHDGTVNILDIVQLTPPYFNVCSGNTYYTERKDFNGDDCINLLDVVRLTPPTFNQSCTP